MKIIHKQWFTSMTDKPCFGIVVIQNEVGEKKAYIGLGIGTDEETDAIHIAERGAKVSKEMLQEVIDVITNVPKVELNGEEKQLLKEKKYVHAIKMVRERTGLGLKESKDLVDRERNLQ